MVTQHQSQCQQHGPLSEPALTVTSINIEGMSAAKQQLLAELCEKQKCDASLRTRNTSRVERNTTQYQRHESGLQRYPHEQYGSAIFVRNNCICDLTSTSNTNNVEIIQAQLNKLTVTSVYKPPNEQFSFGSNLASTWLLAISTVTVWNGDTEVQTKTAD